MGNLLGRYCVDYVFLFYHIDLRMCSPNINSKWVLEASLFLFRITDDCINTNHLNKIKLPGDILSNVKLKCKYLNYILIQIHDLTDTCLVKNTDIVLEYLL